MTVQPGDIVEMPCVTASRRFRETCLAGMAAFNAAWLWYLWVDFELWENAEYAEEWDDFYATCALSDLRP